MWEALIAGVAALGLGIGYTELRQHFTKKQTVKVLDAPELSIVTSEPLVDLTFSCPKCGHSYTTNQCGVIPRGGTNMTVTCDDCGTIFDVIFPVDADGKAFHVNLR